MVNDIDDTSFWFSSFPLDYAGKQAHVELAERMRQRDAGMKVDHGFLSIVLIMFLQVLLHR